MASTSDELKAGSPVMELDLVDEPTKDTKEADAALSFTLGETITYNEADNKRVRRMIDRNIIPWMFLTFTVQYLDNTLLSYASVMGIIQDTNLTSFEYAWYDLHLNLTEDPRCAAGAALSPTSDI
jgi:hypothetical protein